MKFIKTDVTPAIHEFRSELYRRFSAPIDGMWEKLFIASSQHYLIINEGQNIGYCCIDDKNSLNQLYLCSESNYLMDRVVQTLVELKLISSAKLSSIEPVSFNACLANSKSVQINTFCFQHLNSPLEREFTLNVELVSKENTQAVRVFLKDQIGFDDNFGYVENLVKRKEQYMIRESGIIIATGECRLSDSQVGFADIGVVVNKDFQSKGLGTQVLQQLVKRAQQANRMPICSTTYDNIASKKAIEKAGFYCSHIIFDIEFIDEKNKKNDIPGIRI